MAVQHFQIINERIKEQFLKFKQDNPDKLKRRLNFSWSNWGFGMESLAASAKRLSSYGIKYIELHGNHYGNDLGYRPKETLKILADHDIKVGGICGMFSVDNDLSSNRNIHRQNAIDYLRREIEFGAEVGANFLVVPGAVGRAVKYDSFEFERSVEALQVVADDFKNAKIRAAIEPVRSDEVSFVHSVEDAKKYIEAIDHPGIRYINGDVYHMQAEEPHIGQAIMECGEMLANLHLADSNRRALGEGSMDLDTLIMSLYLMGYNNDKCFCTPEPLGSGSDVYQAMYSKPNVKALDEMVKTSVTYFREREEAVLSS